MGLLDSLFGTPAPQQQSGGLLTGAANGRNRDAYNAYAAAQQEAGNKALPYDEWLKQQQQPKK